MLVITRLDGESFEIPGVLTVTIISARRGRAKIGCTGPGTVLRSEIVDQGRRATAENAEPEREEVAT